MIQTATLLLESSRPLYLKRRKNVAPMMIDYDQYVTMLLLENTSSLTSTTSPGATSEQNETQKETQNKTQNKETQNMKNRITKTENRLTKTVTWKPDIDDGWTLVKRKKRSQQKIESNQSIVKS
jgi:hypothetical protein